MKGLEYIEVVVKRGTNYAIPTAIPAYELPVLEMIHNIDTSEGTIAMVTVGNTEVRALPFREDGTQEEFDPQEALNALRRKYDPNNGSSPVLAVFKTAHDLRKYVRLIDIPDPKTEPEPEAMKEQPKPAKAKA